MKDTKYEDLNKTLAAVGKAVFVNFYYDFKDFSISKDELAKKILSENPGSKSDSQNFRIPRARHIFESGQEKEALRIIIESKRVDKKAIEKAVDKGLKIIKNNNQIKDLNKSFIIIDEMTVILSIIKDQSKIVLLERKDSNIFNKYIKIPNNNDNYAIINTFATQALKNYLATKMGTVLPNQA